MSCLLDQNMCRLRRKNRELLQQLQSNSVLLQRRIRGLRQTASSRTPLKSDKSWERLPPSSLKRRYESWRARNNSTGVARALNSGVFKDFSDNSASGPEEESIVRIVNMPTKRSKRMIPPASKDKKTTLSWKTNSRKLVTGKKQTKLCTECYCPSALAPEEIIRLKKSGTGDETTGSEGDFPNELSDCLKDARNVLTYSPKSIFLRRMKQRIKMLDPKPDKEKRTLRHKDKAIENIRDNIHESTRSRVVKPYHCSNCGCNGKPQPTRKHLIDSDDSCDSESLVRSTCPSTRSGMKAKEDRTGKQHPLTKNCACQNDLSDENLEQNQVKRKPNKSVKSQAVQTLDIQPKTAEQKRLEGDENFASRMSEKKLTHQNEDSPLKGVMKESDEIVGKGVQYDKLQTSQRDKTKASNERVNCSCCHCCRFCGHHICRSMAGSKYEPQFSAEMQGAGYDVIAGLVDNEHEGSVADTCSCRLQQLNKFRRDHWFDCHATPRICCGCCAAHNGAELRCSWHTEDLQARKHTCLDPLLSSHTEGPAGLLTTETPSMSGPLRSAASLGRRREITLPTVQQPPKLSRNTRAFPPSRLLVRDMRSATGSDSLGTVPEAPLPRRQRPVPVNSLALRFQKGVA